MPEFLFVAWASRRLLISLLAICTLLAVSDKVHAWSESGYHIVAEIAYQHGFLGNKKTAIKELAMTVELESRDQLASQLLERFGGNTQERAEPAEAPPESEVKP